MVLKMEDYELVKIDSVSNIISPVEEKLYDITVDGDHTFFIKLPESEDFFLMHNCDGNHITSMLIGWFRRFAPNLFDEGRICKLVTPLILVKDSKDKILHFFMNVQEFKAWEAKNPGNRNKIIYLKGLGSWDRQDLIDLIAKYGISKFIQEYKLDDRGKAYIEDWLGDDSEKRKAYLREYSFDINQA